MNKITVNKALTTSLVVAKVAEVAQETGVSLTHIETRMVGRGKWINDFEVVGSPGKISVFFERIDDLRLD